jgi:hypothetical protein
VENTKAEENRKKKGEKIPEINLSTHIQDISACPAMEVEDSTTNKGIWMVPT